MWLPQETIRRKRDGEELTERDIKLFIQGVTDMSVSEGQIAAFTMATLLNGMTLRERTCLTEAYRDSGTVLNWDVDGPVVDKHSSGGVGDLVSLVLGPILAACGCYVPMISGRGLGHTGGTLDKLNSISGYLTEPDLALFDKTVKQCGVAIIGQTAELAPADGRIYSIRDVTATVESIDLITASILSKKLAEGLDVLCMDVKVGNGAFMTNIEDAVALASSIVGVANMAGTKTTALVTDMSQPLANTAGNALEIHETIEILTGKIASPRLWQVIVELAVTSLVSAGLCSNEIAAKEKVQLVWQSGLAAEKFQQMVSILGGPSDLIDNPDKHLPKAKYILPIPSPQTGIIDSIDTRDLGLELIGLGGARRVPTDKLDYAVGLADIKHLGDTIEKGAPLAMVHANSKDVAEQVVKKATDFFHIGDHATAVPPLVHRVISE